MVFSSPTFLFYFLPLFLLVYHLGGRRNGIILVFSLVFYAWGGVAQVPLLLFYIVANYAAGLAVSAAADKSRPLAIGVMLNLSLLLIFKYLGFVETQANAGLSFLGLAEIPRLQLGLPLGISFFTFQGISYLVDIARGEVMAQRSLLKFAMYKTMFPQLIAGPIVRYRQIAGRIDHRRVSAFRLRHGIMLFTLGLAQKTLIANTVAYPADMIFNLPDGQLTMETAWLADLCYMVQILFDFGGYSTMAIGIGHMMGFSYPANFDRPYGSQSVTEFWRRWHMSLSSWFRDYVYIPLGGNRQGVWRTYRNLIGVFALCGFWHGAAWTFLIWGLYHGAFLVLERLGWGRVLAQLWPPLRHAYLLLVVCIGWVFFRAGSLHQAVHFLAVMGGFGDGHAGLAPAARFLTPSVATALAVAALACALPPLSERQVQARIRRLLAARPAWRPLGDGAVAMAFGVGSLALCGMAALRVATNTYNPFIYFRF